MNKIALVLGLSVSMSVHAFEPFTPDEILTMTAPDGSKTLITFSEWEEKLAHDDNMLFVWCTKKGEIARTILYERDNLTPSELLDELRPIKPKIKHHLWLEVQRMIANTYRYNSKGDFIMERSTDMYRKIKQKEYQKCLVNGF